MAKKTVKKTTRKNVARAPAVPAKASVKSNEEISETLAVICLLLNVLILPGLGSLIAKRTKAGIWQLVMAVVGGILCIIVIGIPIVIAAWIWSLITGIDIVKKAKTTVRIEK